MRHSAIHIRIVLFILRKIKQKTADNHNLHNFIGVVRIYLTQ